MNTIQDNRTAPPAVYDLSILAVDAAQIQVTMTTKEGYDAVNTGLATKRAAIVTDSQGNGYTVDLPGFAQPHSQNVTFKRSI